MTDITKEIEKKKKDLFKFWESDLRYRIRQEEEKYNNDASREHGIDWVEMVICKSLKDIIKETESLVVQALAENNQRVIERIKKHKKKNIKDTLANVLENHQVIGYNQALLDILQSLEKGE